MHRIAVLAGLIACGGCSAIGGQVQALARASRTHAPQIAALATVPAISRQAPAAVGGVDRPSLAAAPPTKIADLNLAAADATSAAGPLVPVTPPDPARLRTITAWNREQSPDVVPPTDNPVESPQAPSAKMVSQSRPQPIAVDPPPPPPRRPTAPAKRRNALPQPPIPDYPKTTHP